MSILDRVAQVLYDKKSFNILGLNVKGVSTLTETLIIAEGNVPRHVIALARDVEAELEKYGEKPIHIEGLSTGDWVVLDYGNFIVHLFVPEVRERYSLEQLWHEAAVIDLKIDVNPQESLS